MLEPSPEDLSRAVLSTLAYADIFDYPLTAPEIQHYLIGLSASLDAVSSALAKDGLFAHVGNYYLLPGREKIVSIRSQREARSRELLPRAVRYGRVLGMLPFVRMVALTGSLAVMNIANTADFDYMLIAAPGRVWTARAFALAFNRLTRLRGYTLCPNLILSETALEWTQHDLYSARELCQMIPIKGPDVYARLMNANRWVQSFLPNAILDSGGSPPMQGSALQGLFEFPLCGKLGDRFERWEMNRKIERFSRQEGFGAETIFTADMCQGNFDHHRARTRKSFEKRLAEFELVS